VFTRRLSTYSAMAPPRTKKRAGNASNNPQDASPSHSTPIVDSPHAIRTEEPPEPPDPPNPNVSTTRGQSPRSQRGSPRGSPQIAMSRHLDAPHEEGLLPFGDPLHENKSADARLSVLEESVQEILNLLKTRVHAQVPVAPPVPLMTKEHDAHIGIPPFTFRYPVGYRSGSADSVSAVHAYQIPFAEKGKNVE